MSENRAVYQTNEPNACVQYVWLWKIVRAKCKGRVCSAPMLLQRHSTHEEIRESVRVNYWVRSHNPARTSPGSMFELWIHHGFEWFFVVNFLYPKFAVLARSKQLMPFTVKFRLEFLVCGLPSDLLSHLSMSAPCFHVTKAKKQWRIDIFFKKAYQLSMFAKCDALPKRIEKRFIRHVCLRNPCFLGNLSLHSLREA